MTPLLNGQAVNVEFASTSVTVMRGSMRLMKRAQVAPAKPPPMTTARLPAPCAMAGSGSRAAVAPAAAVLRNSRRFFAVMIGLPSSILLRTVPGGDGFDLVVGEPLGEEMHHGRRLLPRLERLHGGDDVRGVAADEPRHRGLDRSRRGMATGAGQRAGRGIGRTRRQGVDGQGEDEECGSHDACGIHVRVSRMLPVPIVLFSYALRKSWFLSGRERIRLPMAKKMALHKAGARGGTGVSPTPPQKPPLVMMTVSTRGMSASRSIG